MLLDFPSATTALYAVLELSERIANACDVLGLPVARVQAAAHTGVVTTDAKGLVSGEAVNIAARLQQHAQPGELFVTDAVRHSARIDAAAHPAGEVTLRGIATPIEAWRIALGVR